MNRQCRFHNRGRTAVPLPLKGAAGQPAIEGAAPLRRLASPMLLSPPRSPQKNEPLIRGSSVLPEFILKTKGSRFGAMLLDEERGRAAVPFPLKGAAGPPAIERAAPLAKIGFANASIPSTFPTKKRTSHERFVSTSGVRSENQRFPIWRNAFG